jgi:hypothetical protein
MNNFKKSLLSVLFSSWCIIYYASGNITDVSNSISNKAKQSEETNNVSYTFFIQKRSLGRDKAKEIIECAKNTLETKFKEEKTSIRIREYINKEEKNTNSFLNDLLSTNSDKEVYESIKELPANELNNAIFNSSIAIPISVSREIKSIIEANINGFPQYKDGVKIDESNINNSIDNKWKTVDLSGLAEKHRNRRDNRRPADSCVPKDYSKHAKFMQWLGEKGSRANGVLFGGDIFEKLWFKSKMVAEELNKENIISLSSSETTEETLWRLDNGELDNLNCKIFIIEAGATNIHRFKTEKPEWAAEGVKAIATKIRMRYPESYIIIVGSIPPKNDTDQIWRIEKMNSLIKMLEKNPNMFYLDPINSAGKENIDDDDLPTEIGYHNIVNVIKEIIQKLPKS